MSKRTCSVPDCNKTHYGRGWCKFHYQRAYLAGNLEDRPRKLARPTDSLDFRLRNIGWTVTDSGCWEWNGSRDRLGYGQMSAGRGRPWKSYRIAYEAWVKVPEPNVDICHKRDNPPCINPDHLFEGTRAENIADMVRKGRSATWDKRDHKLTSLDVELIRSERTNGRTQRAIAAEYGVSQSLISLILKGKCRTAA